MRTKPRTVKTAIWLPLLSGGVLLLFLVLIGLRFKGPDTDLQNRLLNMVKKEETLSRMRINMLKSVDIEKGAVMADSDELSRALAEESSRAAEAVSQDRQALGLLMESDRVDKEMEMLREFDACWAELRKIDKVLLDFAVENSNIKAANLSFSQGSQAMGRFKQDLAELINRNLRNPQYCQIVKLADDALMAGIEAHYLHAPHIAAANDKDMDRIESEIKHLDEVINNSLNELQRFLSEDNRALLRDARSAYADFQGVTATVIQLSRENTNIKSFELSLGRKRKATAQCEEILTGMQELFRARSFEATR